MELLFLGTGTSHGVPVVACDCAVCRSDDVRDSRWRSSVLVIGAGGERILIDAGPEFRLQAIRARIDRLDAILLTHAHADHTHGLDDVRPLTRRAPMPVYGNEPTIAELRERFSYIFRETQKGGGKPRLDPEIVDAPFAIGDLRIAPIPAKHGVLDIYGWRIEEGNAAAVYLTDVSAVPEASMPLLAEADVFVVGALRDRPHETHFAFGEALDLARRAGARNVYLTHICHEHTHAEIERICLDLRGGSRVEAAPAQDGLRLRVG